MNESNNDINEKENHSGSSYQYNTSIAHRLLTLISFSFLFFEFLFITLYFDNFWFAFDITYLGLFVMLLIMVLMHFFLHYFLESKKICRMLSPIFKGKSAVCYINWLELTKNDITYGIRSIRWQAVEKLQLSFLGNLIIRSKYISGRKDGPEEILLKIPFAAIEETYQKKFLRSVHENNPDTQFDKRLNKFLTSKANNLSKHTQILTAIIMLILLADLSFSSFYFLELMKNYYIAEKAYTEKNLELAKNSFQKANYLFDHSLPISWVSTKLLKQSTVAASIKQEKAKIYELEGKENLALEEAKKALELSPKSLRIRLYLARLYACQNKFEEANKELEKICDEHPDSLMPRLYKLALAKKYMHTKKLQELYKEELAACYESTFENEPYWPPGGNRFFTELFYSEDLKFILNNAMFSDTKIETKN